MAQHNNANNINNIVTQQQQHKQLVKPMFHDFLGMKNNPINSNVLKTPLHITSLSSATVSRCGATHSDLASCEKTVGNHLEGVPFYAPRSVFPGIVMNSRLVGNKRSNSDSTFIGSSRDSFQIVPYSLQNSHLMKMLRNTAGADCRTSLNDDEAFLLMQSLKPTSDSRILQPPTSPRTDANKWEHSILMNVGNSTQHSHHSGQLRPFMDQITSYKIRNASAGPFMSQLSADQGSRTGKKGHGILSSMNTINSVNEKTSSVLGGSRPKPVTNKVDPESSTTLTRCGSSSTSCQMTIFYGSQAHVLDDVQPNKAGVIMALAGSNGVSWSTTFSPKSCVKLHGASNLRDVENETVVVSNVSLPPDLNGRSLIISKSSHVIVPGDRVTTPTGNPKFHNLYPSYHTS